MILRSRYFLLYLLGAILLGIPSDVCWFREPFLITRYEYDFFLGLIPGDGVEVHPTVLLLGKTIHFVILILMGWSYYRLIVSLQDQEDRLRGSELVLPVVLLTGVCFAYLPWLSPDVFYYFGTGWQESHYGLNPYQYAVSDIPDYLADPFFQNCYELWQRTITPYGPLFLKLMALITQLGGGEEKRALVVIKGLFTLSHLLNGWFVYLLSKQLNLKRKLVVLTFLLNPALLVCYIGWAHNDILMVTCILASIVMLLRQRHVLATVFLALGVGLKYFPLILFPYFLIFMLRGRWSPAHLLRAAGLTVLFVIASLSPSFLYEGGIGNVRLLFAGRGQLFRNILYYTATLNLMAFGIEDEQVVKMVLKGIFMLIYAGIALFLLQKKETLTTDSLFASLTMMLLFYFIIGSPEIHEWYLGWFLGLIFWINDRAYFQAGMILSTVVNPFFIYEIKSPFLMIVFGWWTCFLILWCLVLYLYHQGRQPVREPSPLFEGKPVLPEPR